MVMVFEEEVIKVICVYAPQVGRLECEKERKIRRESHPLGVATSVSGSRHRQKKVGKSSKERANC